MFCRQREGGEMGKMEFDFRKAESQIRELENIADDLERIVASGYADTMQEISGAWSGTGADAYMKKAGRVQDKIEDTIKDLRSTARVYRDIVKEVRRKEQHALTCVLS